jgi:membrane protease YdiL (CAAX protease family)
MLKTQEFVCLWLHECWGTPLLRGSYHLYQGIGGFIGNLGMGVFFAIFFVRTRRVGPLIVAHAIIDSVAFVGYAFAHGHWAVLS